MDEAETPTPRRSHKAVTRPLDESVRAARASSGLEPPYIEDVPLSSRAYYTLLEMGIKTAAQAQRLSWEDLCRHRGCGEKTTDEIQRAFGCRKTQKRFKQSGELSRHLAIAMVEWYEKYGEDLDDHDKIVVLAGGLFPAVMTWARYFDIAGERISANNAFMLIDKYVRGLRGENDAA